jgi:hypothetical protein
MRAAVLSTAEKTETRQRGGTVLSQMTLLRTVRETSSHISFPIYHSRPKAAFHQNMKIAVLAESGLRSNRNSVSYFFIFYSSYFVIKTRPLLTRLTS